jgi:hypothetical protein
MALLAAMRIAVSRAVLSVHCSSQRKGLLVTCATLHDSKVEHMPTFLPFPFCLDVSLSPYAMKQIPKHRGLTLPSCGEVSL